MKNTNWRKLSTKLAVCLQHLRDLQNGCPLPSYEKNWDKVMANTKECLSEFDEALPGGLNLEYEDI